MLAMTAHYFRRDTVKIGLMPPPPTDLETAIEAFVERWYSREMDIGRTRFMGVEVDLLPDAVEKHLYKKMLAAVVTFLREGRPTVSIAGMEFELRAVGPAASDRERQGAE